MLTGIPLTLGKIIISYKAAFAIGAGAFFWRTTWHKDSWKIYYEKFYTISNIYGNIMIYAFKYVLSLLKKALQEE